MTTKETIHLKKPKLVRSTAREDFAPKVTETPVEVAPKETRTEPLAAPSTDGDEEQVSSRRDLDNMTLLDIFAMQASAGVAKRLEDPQQIAIESFRIGHEMVRKSLQFRQKKS